MEFSEAIQKLRSRLGDAISLGVGEDNPAEFTMAALIQVMNEAERHRQDCLRQMVSYRELAKGCEFQASAYCQMHSLIYSVYNNLITAEEKAQRERREVERRKADALTEAVNATEVASAAAIVDLETAAIVEIIPVTPPVALPSATIIASMAVWKPWSGNWAAP